MLKQIIKMVWRRKQIYWGIYIEQAFVFIILSFCLAITTEFMSKIYAPGLLDTDNVIVMLTPDPSNAELEQMANSFITCIKQSPDIIHLSKSINFAPYFGAEVPYDSVCIDNKMLEVKVKYIDENAYKIFKPILNEGTWLTDTVRSDGTYSAVITKQLVDKLGWETSLGRQIAFMQKRFTIVGVMEGLKEQVLIESPASLILPVNTAIYNASTPPVYIIKLKDGQRDNFYSFYTKELSKIYYGLELDDDLNCINLDTIKSSELYGVNITITAMTLICFFIILYTFIGSYGLISLHSERRAGEYALQMALGLTKKSLMYRVLLENLIVTLLSAIPGIIIILVVLSSSSIKMPIMVSLVVSLLIMILFSLFSAWLPAFKVSKLSPAEVLKNDL